MSSDSSSSPSLPNFGLLRITEASSSGLDASSRLVANPTPGAPAAPAAPLALRSTAVAGQGVIVRVPAEDEVLITSIRGSIIRSPFSETLNEASTPSAMETYATEHPMDMKVSQDMQRKRDCFMFSVNTKENLSRLGSHLRTFCLFTGIGIGQNSEGVVVFTAIGFRKGSNFVTTSFLNFGIIECICPRMWGLRANTQHRHDKVFEFMASWCRFHRNVITDFKVVQTNVANKDSVLSEWDGRDTVHIIADVLECQSVPKRQRTDRQLYIAEHAVKLQQLHTELNRAAVTRNYMIPGDETVPDLRNLTAKPSLMQLTYVDVVGVAPLFYPIIMQMSLREWLRTGHTKLSLVLHGKSGGGKTPVAKALGLCLCGIHPQPDGSESKLWLASNVEQLPRSSMRTGDVIFMDEFKPDAVRGCNPAHTIDDIKMVLDAEISGGLHGKGSNSATTGCVTLPAGVCKIITSNAESPHGWYSVLPAGVFSMAPGALGQLDENVKAILKRVAFLHVVEPLLPSSVVADHHGATRSATASTFDAVHSGDNAIP